jgi:hypothetical protein
LPSLKNVLLLTMKNKSEEIIITFSSNNITVIAARAVLSKW